MDQITKDYAEHNGWQVNGHLIKLTKRQWIKYTYAGYSIRYPGKRTLMVPTTDGTALLIEGKGFEII
jgi:hypothetical protein